MKSLTVLAPQNDPFRVDTPAGHRDAQWLTDKINDLGLTGPRHLRGLHYALIGQTKPNGLPSTPLKDTERRATKWFEATGVEQTEIDAALTLQPQLVEELAVEAVRSYFDATLASRVREAEREWERQAQRVLDESGGEHLAQLRTETAAVLETKRQEIQELLDGVRIDPAQLGIELPGLPDLPPAEVTPNYRPPLVDSGWTFPEQCEGLIASKQYRAAGGDSR